MQIPIVSGIYADSAPGLRTSYPVNMVPVPKQSGISNGFLRPADGIISLGTGPGIDRGGIEWNGVCYRVMGTKLVTVSASGTVAVLGEVGGREDSLVSMTYSFDRLAVASGGSLFYWDGSVLTKVTDGNLGLVLDVTWIDGYFMTTDGNSLVVTELTDPTQVNPLKYGSAEADPDPIVALLKLRNEVYALNRNTIEVFDNVGGEFFPFERISGAQIQKGAIGTHACCIYMEAVAFVGGGRNEQPAVYVGTNAAAQKISTQEIDQLLLAYTEDQLSGIKLEARNDRNHQLLYAHLPDRTVVYDASASSALGEPVWHVLTTGLADFLQYRARNFVWCYDAWLCGDPASSSVGRMDDKISSHWGEIVRWEFGTAIAYNNGAGAIFNSLELVALPGNVQLGIDPIICTSYSLDGVSWSAEKQIRCGARGNTTKRLVWLQQGHMRSWRIQRFRGTSQAHIAFARLEAQIEPLAN